MADALAFLADETIHLRDRSYRWIDIKRFRLVQDSLEPRTALAAVLSHPQYRDHYTSPDSVVEAPLHGPYRLPEIQPSSFDEVNESSATQLLQEWMDRYGPVAPTEIEGNVQSAFDLLKAASSRFLLRDLGAAAQHEFGWVLSDFREFITIDQGRAEVALIVAAGD